jgi:hypothetical protein
MLTAIPIRANARRLQCWQGPLLSDRASPLVDVRDQNSKSALSEAGPNKVWLAKALVGLSQLRPG